MLLLIYQDFQFCELIYQRIWIRKHYMKFIYNVYIRFLNFTTFMSPGGPLPWKCIPPMALEIHAPLPLPLIVYTVPVRPSSCHGKWQHVSILLGLNVDSMIWFFSMPEESWINSGLGSGPLLPLSLIHIWRCRRSTLCRSRWSPYH